MQFTSFSSGGTRIGMALVGGSMLLGASLLPAQSTPASSMKRIPAVRGNSLAGTEVVLPDALRGKVGVLVLGFSRGSQGQVTTWGRRLAAEWKDSASVVYYEMPMLAGVPRLLRGVVTRSMKSSIPERAQSRFVPITSDEDAWRALAHYSKGDDAYVLVVDGDGRVIWQTEGEATDAAFGEVKERVAGMRGASEGRN